MRDLSKSIFILIFNVILLDFLFVFQAYLDSIKINSLCQRFFIRFCSIFDNLPIFNSGNKIFKTFLQCCKSSVLYLCHFYKLAKNSNFEARSSPQSCH